MNYTLIHVHTDFSNVLQQFDSLIKYKDLIKWCSKQKMTSLAITEHGGVHEFILKKQECDENNIKYIHASEFYVAYDLNLKKRQNFHMCLYAKNYEGVKELNKLSSISFQGNASSGWTEGDHFYYLPRISLDEVINTSDNILITSACLGSILWQQKDSEHSVKLLKWMSKNNHRCFLEIMAHEDEEQIKYNQYLNELSIKYNIPLIASTDSHVIKKEDQKLRSILLRAKKKEFHNEENFDLSLKTYNQLVADFKRQKSLPMDVVLMAIENTNKLADMCENWKLDKSHKYPKIYKNPQKELRERLNKNIKHVNIDKEELSIIENEIKVFEKCGMTEFNLLVHDVTSFCQDNNISFQPRGSCNGSQLYYRLGITDINAKKFGLHFFRFCNPDRISLGDVDIDMSSEQRPIVKDFLYNYKNLNSCAIITYQTLALRGAVRQVVKGLGLSFEIENMIAKDIIETIEVDEFENEKKITTFNNKQKWEKEYPEVMEFSYKAIGLIENSSVHACGFVCSDLDLHEHIGTYESKKSEYIISQNAMKAIDSVNFVKMDLLNVNNVQIIDDTCRLAKIQLKNDELDMNDDNVWDSMKNSGLGIFQMEGVGQTYLKTALNNFDNFLQTNPKMTKYDLLLALNAVVRPACDSIRNEFLNGYRYDIGCEVINDLFSSTQSYIIFQENIMMFLQEFCGYSGNESDTIRRAIGKKLDTKELLPEIERRFVDFMGVNYSLSKTKATKVIKKFLKIVEDATNYGFSTNHSCPYTLLGYKGAYLRHYYPLEFLTVQLNINQGKMDKISNITDYISKYTNIKIEPICFKKSKSKYFFEKETNSIYKGLSSIKGIGDKIGDELFDIKKEKSFIKLIWNIKEKSSINKSQLKNLIKLNYFKEYGKIPGLIDILDKYYETKKDKKIISNQISLFEEKAVEDVLNESILKEENEILKNHKQDISLKEKLSYELELYNYIESIENDEKYRNKLYITDLKPLYTKKDNKIWGQEITFYSIMNGKVGRLTIFNKKYQINPIYIGDIINAGAATKDNYGWKLHNWSIFER